MVKDTYALLTGLFVLVLGAVGVMLWVGGMDVIAGRISGGELAAFVFYSLIVGGAYGRGQVFEKGGRLVGYCDVSQGSIGRQPEREANDEFNVRI